MLLGEIVSLYLWDGMMINLLKPGFAEVSVIFGWY